MRQRDNDEKGRREPPPSSPQPRESGKGVQRPSRRFSMLDRLRGHGRQERGDSRR